MSVFVSLATVPTWQYALISKTVGCEKNRFRFNSKNNSKHFSPTSNYCGINWKKIDLSITLKRSRMQIEKV